MQPEVSTARLFGEEGHGVRLVVSGTVAEIVLARPAKLNALNLPMLDALDGAISALAAEPGVRVAILSGEGRGFCAGGDILAWGHMEPLGFAQGWVRRGHAIFDRLARLPVPLIALLDGHALGGGLELAACADFRVAEEQVKFGFPESSIGVVPGWSGTQRAARRFGIRIVRRMALGGEVLTAREALGEGLADRLAPTGEGRNVALAWARSIAARAPTATQAVKLLLNMAEGEEREGAAEALASAFVATTADRHEGVASFREKRPAAFPGR